MADTQKILRIDASMRRQGSTTRALGNDLIAQLGQSEIVSRDLIGGLPVVDETWIGANFTAADERTAAQRTALELSDRLVEELKVADVLVINTPIYNFGVPAALKAWVDLIARAGVTFRYTENGPVGLLENKRAFIVLASGGTKVGSEIDFASGYLRHIMGFVGIHDVEIIAADQQMIAGEQSVTSAKAQINRVTAYRLAAAWLCLRVMTALAVSTATAASRQ